jgi:nucleoside-diphosphate-sugar epimerase
MGEGTTGVCDESSRCRPRSAYGVSKLEAERALLRLADENDLQLTIMRLPLVYGPGCKGNVYRLLQAAAAGRSLPLGRVRNRRSMAYVGNVVAAGLAALTATSSSGKLYLVADDRPYSTAEIYGAMCEALGKPPALRAVPVSLLRLLGTLGGIGERLLRRPLPVNPRAVRRLTGDLVFRTDRIRRELGFRPPFDLKEGMAETVAWYRNSGAAGDVR